jgi:murein DD-endopeptidase MepM/ murein hydrolase activator NlpD
VARSAAVEAREQAFAKARRSAFKDAKRFVRPRKPPGTGVVKAPYAQAYSTLYAGCAPALLRFAAGSAGRIRLARRIDGLVRDALAAAGLTPPKSAYVSPVVPGTLRKRTDSGVDFQGEPGAPVLAIGNAEVTSARRVGGFGMLVVYRLLDGPRAGQHIYVGHAEPVAKSGQMVKAGTPVARLKEHAWGLRKTSPHSRGWVEIGFAANSQGLPESYEEHDPGVEHDLSTRAGVEFSTFLRRHFAI